MMSGDKMSLTKRLTAAVGATFLSLMLVGDQPAKASDPSHETDTKSMHTEGKALKSGSTPSDLSPH